MDLLCDVLHDLERTKNSDVYFRILLLVCMSALVLIGWGGDVCGRAFAAKGLIHLKTLRRFAVAHFALEKHLLLVTSWWLIAIWLFVFWIPLYSVLRN